MTFGEALVFSQTRIVRCFMRWAEMLGCVCKLQPE